MSIINLMLQDTKDFKSDAVLWFGIDARLLTLKDRS